MIKLENIKREFRTKDFVTTALNGVSIDIDDGEFVAVMGPSGCGKSTLLNILGMLDAPTEGTYLLDGIDVSEVDEDRRTELRKGQIGFVFQAFNLIDELNVYENVELPLLYLDISRQQRRETVEEILAKLKMSHRSKHFPNQLSGGQQQRVAVARAVVAKPRIILADEPTGNLDSKNGMEVMELLRQMNDEGTTVVMVTHSQHDATFAHRIVNLYDGQTVNNMNGLL